MLAASVLPGATLVNSFHEGNSVFLRLNDGAAQIEWLSESSFRFSRSWDGSFTRGPDKHPESINLKISETPEFLKIATKYLLVTISKTGILARVAESDGTTIMADATEVEITFAGAEDMSRSHFETQDRVEAGVASDLLEMHAHEKFAGVAVAKLCGIENIAAEIEQESGHGMDNAGTIRTRQLQDKTMFARHEPILL